MTKKKVVIFTGGGYFGVTIAAFLSYLPKGYLMPEHVDVLSGTSIGGIITCALMAGCTGDKILEGFVNEGKRIFTRRWQNKINPLSIPFYSNKALGEVVEGKWCPCPTTEELFLKLPYARLLSIGSSKYEAQYMDEATGEYAVTTGKTPAEALCRCFLEIYKKTKGK